MLEVELSDKQPSAAEEKSNTPKQDILIAGGNGGRTCLYRRTEIFSWEKNAWVEVSLLNEEHLGASSFIDKNHIFIVGGAQSKTIEKLDINQLPLKWKKVFGKLPFVCGHQQTVVCQQSGILHIGGYSYDEQKRSNLICELRLTSPCSLKKLCTMPHPRACSGAEVVYDKVVILGGYDSQLITDSVLEFDPAKNNYKEMPKLPFALTEMATVCWRGEIVVIGGEDKDRKVRNDVYIYNSKTGKVTVLPSMLEKRYDCAAVITADTIVVMGGWNEKGETLSSVECFTMGTSGWQYLPSMNFARSEAAAVVLPPGRKYV